MRISDWSSDVCSSDLNSSNSNRLRELAESRGTPSYLIDGAQDIQPQWLEGKKRVGVTAGASAPEVLVKDVITRLKLCGGLERSEEHTSELQSLMRISYAVFCLKKKKNNCQSHRSNNEGQITLRQVLSN